MIFKIAILDDLKEDRMRLVQDIKSYFADDPEVNLSMNSYATSKTFLEKYEPDSYQLVFLDICMEEPNGIEVARKLREIDTKVLIVFLTTSKEYAFDAFPVHPFDYLIKPYVTETLHHLLGEVLRVLSSTDEREITLRVSRGTYSVPVRNIISVISQGHSVEGRTTSKHLIRCLMTFATVEEMLKKEARFLRCNRGILINMDHVLSLGKDAFKMIDGSSFSMRVRKRSELVSLFSQYQLSRMKRRVES